MMESAKGKHLENKSLRCFNCLIVWPYNSFTATNQRKTKMKYAAHTGSMHAAARVTPFFNTHSEAADHAAANNIGYSFIKQISNWKEHQQWNIDKVGFYAEHQVKE